MLRTFTSTADVEGQWMGAAARGRGLARSQAIDKGVDGADWEKLHYKFVEMNKEVNVRNSMGVAGHRRLGK